MTRLQTPFTDEMIRSLSMGEQVLLSGEIYTARDAAHQRMAALLEEGLPLPFDPAGSVVFYAGPCPAPQGRVIGSIGPTTAGRMDNYAPRLMAAGLRVMIGKGDRRAPVIDAIRMYTGVYFAAVGGAAALMARCVTVNDLIAFEDLGAEAIRRLTVRELPLTVAIDCLGNNIYTNSLSAPGMMANRSTPERS